MMSIKAYLLGNLIRVTAEFSIGGVDTDPTTVTLEVKDPAGTVTTPIPVKDAGQGKYHADINVNAAGDWWYRWEGTGVAQAAAEQRFIIKASKFP
jgi:hypothetical protein